MALILVQTSPLSHQIGSQRPFVTRTLNIAGKTYQCVFNAVQFKTQLPAFGEIVINLVMEISVSMVKTTISASCARIYFGMRSMASTP